MAPTNVVERNRFLFRFQDFFERHSQHFAELAQLRAGLQGLESTQAIHKCMLKKTDEVLYDVFYRHMPDEVLICAQWWQKYQHALLISYMFEKLSSHQHPVGHIDPPTNPSTSPVLADRQEAAHMARACFCMWKAAINELKGESSLLLLHWHSVQRATICWSGIT